MSGDDLKTLAALKKEMQAKDEFSWTDQQLQGVQAFALVHIAEELTALRQEVKKLTEAVENIEIRRNL